MAITGAEATSAPKLELRQVGLKYVTVEGETEALKDLSLAVREGEFVAIVGPSGCGKSTLLSLVAGLVMPTSGHVLVGGQEVHGPSRQVGYMLQEDYLFKWRDVVSNVLLGLEIQGRLDPESRVRAIRLLEKYGLGDFKRHLPRQLSGGMRQRVALIRTLAIDPEILLLDEPFSALDYQTRLTIQDEVVQILRREGKTTLLVTHDISEAICMADRVIVLSRRPGRVKAEYPIRIDGGRLTPLERRESGQFARYFDQIWKELDVHVEARA
jgi:NitT/TauT family transport system ATP-binding protein